jgi:hypothetical protein
MGWGGQPHAPAASKPEKDPVPILQEAGYVPGPDWTGAENLVPTWIRSRTVESVVSRYTYWSTGPNNVL